MKQSKTFILLITAVSLLITASSSWAAQGGATHYISGEFNDFSTTVPTAPGWVFGNVTVNYNDGTFNKAKGIPFGHTIGLDVTANMTAEVPLVMYAYPTDLLGATWASGVGIPYNWVRVKAKGTIDKNGVSHNVTREQSTSGLGDIQLLPIMAGWTNGDVKFDFVMNVWAPTGDYNQDNLANCGLGYWTFTPMLVVSWLSSKIGTEVSLFTGVDFNTENTEANYQSGNLFHVDATVAQHFPLFGGFAGAGASAFWMKQISNDSGSGAKLGGFQLESYGIGPKISYAHKVGNSDLIFDASWLTQTYSDNTTKGSYLWVKVMLVF